MALLLLFGVAGSAGCTLRPSPAAGMSELESRGLRLVWRDDLGSHLGEPASETVLFGPFGLSSEWIRAHAAARRDNRIIARAPDGLPSLQFNVPSGNVPHDQMASLHWPEGVTHAGVAVDVWIPEDFQFSAECASGSWSSYPGQGRWPIGLWIGGKARNHGGGVPIPQQEGVSVRLNRSSGADRSGQAASFSAYIYHLNRWPPQCERDDAPCSTDCGYATHPNQRCYGGLLSRRSGYTPRGRWVPVVLEVKMNDSGQQNGCVAFWVDGVLIDSGCGMDLGRDKGWLIRGYNSYQMWHCDGSAKEQHWWMSNIRLYAEHSDLSR
jgi:hypothetical protein